MQRVKCVRLYAAKSNGNAKIDLLQDVIYILKRTPHLAFHNKVL